MVSPIDDTALGRCIPMPPTASSCPPLHEPFGMVVLEAWASRLPVVVAKVGGLQALIDDHVDGSVYSNPGSRRDDPGGLATAMVALAQDSSLCARLANAGYRKAQQRYSLGPYLPMNSSISIGEPMRILFINTTCGYVGGRRAEYRAGRRRSRRSWAHMQFRLSAGYRKGSTGLCHAILLGMVLGGAYVPIHLGHGATRYRIYPQIR